MTVCSNQELVPRTREGFDDVPLGMLLIFAGAVVELEAVRLSTLVEMGAKDVNIP
jgi:hypothetical protein